MQKAILVGVNLNENLDFDHSMEELENLAEACEIEAAAQVVQNLPMVNNGGRGQKSGFHAGCRLRDF